MVWRDASIRKIPEPERWQCYRCGIVGLDDALHKTRFRVAEVWKPYTTWRRDRVTDELEMMFCHDCREAFYDWVYAKKYRDPTPTLNT